jgi:hypothetical protein
MEKIQRTRRFSQDLCIILDQVLVDNYATRELAFAQAEKLLSSEMFRFYAAIAEWEKRSGIDE